MCGVAGEIVFGDAPLDTTWCHFACETMAHRGPDGDGFWVDRNVTLGHRRLSIIDLSGGDQPMSYQNGRYTITFNGEIYNYRSLKSELRALGCDFATSSDTEVILAAYSAWGDDSFRRLDGIFAFALWDAERQRLVVVRDHLGVKPLLYHADEGGLRFASELKALLAHPRVSAEIDPRALQDYLQLGYVLTPRTLIKNVFKLPPGSFLSIEHDRVDCRAYWNLAEIVNRPASPVRNIDAAVREFDERLAGVVEQQMVSDVPLGAFLSGGVDSSGIVAHAVDQMKGGSRFKTFSIGFDEPTFSELDYAAQAARHLDSEHYQQIVHAPSFSELKQLVWYYDEALGDTSLIPTYYVAKLAREHVTVSLSGDGGDELLAGYDTYVADRLQRLYAHIPGWLHSGAIVPAVNRIPASSRKVSLDFKLKQFVAYAHSTPERAHFSWRLMMNPTETEALAGGAGDYSPFETYARHYDDVPDAHPLNRSLYVDIKTWLVDDILAKVDRASMACSLEARVPFLSPKFVEYAMQLPPDLKLRGRQRKYILKETLRKRLPANLIDRQKRGFNAPVSNWMRGAWRNDFEELLRGGTSTLIDTKAGALQTLWNEHVAGSRDHGFKLWTVFSLLLWEQQVYQQAKELQQT